jgi:TolA-binding protein
MRWRLGIAGGIVLTLGASVRADGFSTAAGYYATGQWRQAAAAFGRWIQLEPADPRCSDAEFFRAEALVQLQQYDAAAERFEAFVAAYPQHSLVPRARFRLGECRYLLGQHAEAIELLRQFTDQYPQHELNEYALPYLGFSLVESDTGSTEEARRVLADAADRYPRGAMTESCQYRLIELDEHERNVRDMQQRLAALRHDSPHTEPIAEWHYWRGVLYELTNDVAGALAEFERAAPPSADNATKARAMMRAAKLLVAQNDRAAAVAKFEAVTTLSDPLALVEESYLGRIRLAADAGEVAVAERWIQAFRERFPDSPRRRAALRMAGELSLRENDFGEAVERFRELAQTTSAGGADYSAIDQAVTTYMLATAHYQAGDSSESLGLLEGLSSRQLPPALLARVEYARASAHGQLHQTDLALAALARAQAVDEKAPFVDRIRWKRMRLLTQAEQWDEAFGELRGWAPTAHAAWFYRDASRDFAESAFAAARYDQAASAFGLLLSQLPDDADTAYGLSGLGWCQLQQERWTEAAQLFQRLTEKFPDDPLSPPAILARAYCLEKTGDLRAATELYRHFIQHFPAHADRWRADLKAAQLLEQQRAYTDAMHVVEEGLQAARDDRARDRLRYLLACLRQCLGQDDDARAILEPFNQQGPLTPYWDDATYRLARDAWQRGDHNAASAWLDQLLASEGGPHGERVRPFALYLRARIAAEQANWHDVLITLDDLQLAYPASPLATAAQVWSLEALYQLGDYENVRYRLTALREQNADLKPAWQRLVDLRDGQTLAAEQHWQPAIDLAQPLVDSLPHDDRWAEASLLVGRCRQELGQFDAARRTWTLVIENPQDVAATRVDAAWLNIGNSHYAQGQYQTALDAFLHVRPRHDSDLYAAALFQVAGALERLGRTNEATQVYQRLAASALDTPYRAEALEALKSRSADPAEGDQRQLPVSKNSPAKGQ